MLYVINSNIIIFVENLNLHFINNNKQENMLEKHQF